METLTKGKKLFKFKADNSTARLEQLLSEENFENSLQQLKPELLYGKNTDLFKRKYATYMFKARHDCSVLDKEHLNINLITNESNEKLLSKKFSQIHLGLIVIAVTNKIRAGTSAKAHLTIIDQRHIDFQKLIIANAELDMSGEKRMVACSPNYTVTINKFLEKIKINVQTKGYEMVKNSKNLYIDTYFIGKVYNTLIEDTRFDKMVQGLTSHCTNMIIPHGEDKLKYAGEPWNLDNLLTNNTGLQWSMSNYFFDEHRCSVRYTNYKPIQYEKQDEEFEELTQRVEPTYFQIPKTRVEHLCMIIEETDNEDWITKLNKEQFSEHIATLVEQYLNDAETNKELFENIIDGDKYLGE